MNKYLYTLLIAQFLSAFADNTVLFTIIAVVLQSAQPGWYVPALQGVFLAAFLVLAPWVGGFADKYPKSWVLIIANLLKAGGAGLLLLHVEPLIAYCVVGVGAAVFSPAKYGILPELVGRHALVKANSWIEGSTILAILTGMVVGAKVADYSVNWALSGSIALFLISAAASLLLPKAAGKTEPGGWKVWIFYQKIRSFLAKPRSQFAVLGGALFWATAACVRVIIIAWAPLVLMAHNADDIAELTLFLALGIITGAALVPRLIPLEHIRRTCFPAYCMGLLIIALSFTEAVWPARSVLFFMGAAGGMMIVPINAALQEIGKQSIGSGCAVVTQNFFQNFAMLLSVGLYTIAASQQVVPMTALIALGALVITATTLLMLHLPDIS
ncbi:MAG: lysophospholipid transporter LplT [Methylomonas sp.]|jgi:LPLT family lysophospholipid transporter-like MFS transporter